MNRVRTSTATNSEAVHALDRTIDRVRLEVKSAYLGLKDSRIQIDVARKAVDQAEENYRITLEHFSEQLGINTDVLDKQTLLTKTRINHVFTVSDNSINYTRIGRNMGIMVVE
ncbi:TolC family protein, partial [bacterium]|nr:TolC family protein [bacterium]